MTKDTFYYKRVEYKVTDRLLVGGKEFLISSQLSSGDRRRYLAFDRVAGPKGALRILQIMPRTEATWQRVGVLHKLSRQNQELPQIREFYRRGNEVVSIETWIEGRDLRWWIRKMRESGRQRLGTPEAMRLFRQLAHAIAHLHRHLKIVHGDIKPANIILSNDSRRLTLIDYGSAWGVERTSRRVNGDGTSNIYAAPELILGAKSTNFRADYFSLAAVCFEVLTLQIPYEGLGGRAGLPKYRSQSDSLYVPPSELSPERNLLDRTLWGSIDSLISKALKLDPNDRHSASPEWLSDWDRVVNQIRNPERVGLLERLIFGFSDWLKSRKA